MINNISVPSKVGDIKSLQNKFMQDSKEVGFEVISQMRR